jgi:hypothetical protein
VVTARHRRFGGASTAVLALVALAACSVPTGAGGSGGSGGAGGSGGTGGSGPELTFTASADIGATAEAEATLDQVPTLGAEFHLALGDLSYGDPGEEPAWCDFVTERVGEDIPFQLLAGNHESNGENGAIDAFAECLPSRLPGLVGQYARQYYVDVPADDPLARLVMISPGITFPDGTWSYADGTDRADWTRRAIEDAGASGIPWVVVGMHKPCLSMGNYRCDPGPDIVDLLVSSGADLVIGGHEHIYQRSAQLGFGDGCDSISPETVSPACIADAGDDLQQGAGTVFVTVGTGGTALRDVYPDDAEAGYFGAWSGANSEPSWGNLKVVLSETALEAEFVPAVGGFSDRFRVEAATAATEDPAP